MTFAAALYLHLSTDATIAGYVGTRIYPVAGPDERQSASAEFPDCLVYQQLSREQDPNIPQRSNHRVERWGVVAVSSAYDRVRLIAEAVESRLDYYQGTMGQSGSPLSGGLKVKSVTLEDQSDSADFETQSYAVSMIFRVAYQPA